MISKSLQPHQHHFKLTFYSIWRYFFNLYFFFQIASITADAKNKLNKPSSKTGKRTTKEIEEANVIMCFNFQHTFVAFALNEVETGYDAKYKYRFDA
jgi:hypothetical protein